MAAIHQIPRGGLLHPVFERAGPADQILAAFVFEPRLLDSQLTRASEILEAWSEAAKREPPTEPVHCDPPFLGPRALRIRVHGLLDARESLRDLSRTLSELLPVREAHFSRWLAVAGREEPAAVLDPDAPEELGTFASPADYVRALFDPAAPPPASEYEGFGRAAFETRNGDIVLEDRGMPLHLPPLRIGYGKVQGDFTGGDVRSAQVRDALAQALESVFSGLATEKTPRFFDRAGSFGQIDRIQGSAGIGYGFAFASPELILRLTNTCFRYREHELFEALAQTVEAVGLSSVVSWQRFGKPFAKDWKQLEVHVFQLWENFAKRPAP